MTLQDAALAQLRQGTIADPLDFRKLRQGIANALHHGEERSCRPKILKASSASKAVTRTR